MTNKPLRLSRIWDTWMPVVIVVDSIVVFCCGQISAWALDRFAERDVFYPLPDSWFLLLCGVSVSFPVVMQLLGFYKPTLEPFTLAAARRRILVWCSLMLSVVLLLFATKSGAHFSRLWVGNWFLLVCVVFILETMLLHTALNFRRKAGIGARRILIAGSGPLAQRVASLLGENEWLGLYPIGYLEESCKSLMPSTLACLGVLDDVEIAVSENDVHEVWITLPLAEQARIQLVLKRMRQNLVDVRLVPDIFMYDILNRDFDEVLGLPVIGLTTSPQRGLDRALKRLLDVFGALFALLLLSPIMFGCACAVAATSRGGVIFRQERHGLDGRLFTTFKFRTMYVQSETESAYQQATFGDPRITPLGRVMRKFSLDELPQLLNVLRGDMSLVGPRPHPANMNVSYWDDIDRYALRHRVKPGLTGWAQVHGLRGETKDVELLRKRIEYDLFYIDNWSLLLDAKILLRTLWVIWSQPTAY